MNIALMNEKVVFQKNGVTVDAIGNHRNEWTDDYSCYATIGGEGLASSKETESAGTIVSGDSMTVTVRWCQKVSAITSLTHRVIFRDEIYDITNVDHMNFKKEAVKFTCRKVRR